MTDMTDQQGDIAQLASDIEVLDLLECPICNEIPLPPIYTCQNGHTICHVCLKKIKKCGLCQKPFTDARNYFMESVILSSKHRCPFHKQGCKELIRGDVLETHIRSCSFGKPKSTERIGGSEGDISRFKVISGCYQWIQSDKNTEIPTNAVEGGMEYGDRLYIARCRHANSIIPGKLNSSTHLLTFPYLGKECNKSEYEVLISIPDTLIWVSVINGQLPPNAVIAGRTNIGEALYLGRCGHQGTLAVGSVLPSTKSCCISSKGIEFNYTTYEVLVKNEKGIQLDLGS